MSFGAAATLLVASCAGSTGGPATSASAADPAPAAKETSSPATTAAITTPTATTAPAPPEGGAPARINVTTSGTISRDETWSGEIHLTGDIQLSGGSVLTVEPGTVVYVASLSDDRRCCPGDFDDEYTRSHDDPTRFGEWNMATIVINGRDGVIRAVGTPSNPIVFRPEGDGTSPAQWEGIHVERGTIQHAQVWYGGHTAIQVLDGGGDALSFEPEVEIAYNEVRHFLWAGIDSHANDVWIHHNVVEGGGHQAIGVRGNTRAEHNIVLRAQTGIAVEAGNRAVVRNNVVVDSTRGMELRSGQNIQVLNNTIAWVEGPPQGWYFGDELIYPAFENGGGIENYLNSLGIQIINNVVYGPFDWGIGLHQAPGGASIVDHNLVWGPPAEYAGGGSDSAGPSLLVADPGFVEPGDGDFHLTDDSPAVDAGHPSLLDPDGSASDLGAYGGPAAGGW